MFWQEKVNRSKLRTRRLAHWPSLLAAIVAWLWAAVPLQSASLGFNEVVALNDTGRIDEDGDRPDWLELFNGSTNAVNLGGYGLSDDDA